MFNVTDSREETAGIDIVAVKVPSQAPGFESPDAPACVHPSKHPAPRPSRPREPPASPHGSLRAGLSGFESRMSLTAALADLPSFLVMVASVVAATGAAPAGIGASPKYVGCARRRPSWCPVWNFFGPQGSWAERAQLHIGRLFDEKEEQGVKLLTLLARPTGLEPVFPP